MNSLKFTLKDVFSIEEEETIKKGLSLAEKGQSLTALREEIGKDFPSILWPKIFQGLSEQFLSLLDIPLSDIMIRCWNNYLVLSKYRDLKKYPPEKTYLVALAEHSIKSEHRPYLFVKMQGNGIELEKKIDFFIQVVLTIEGLVLEIRAGKIMKIIPGGAKGSGSVSCEGFDVLKSETRAIRFPASWDLGEGVPIGP